MAEATKVRRGRSKSSGGPPIRTVGIISLTIVFVLVGIALLYLLMSVWPPPLAEGESTATKVKVEIPFWDPMLFRDQQLLLIVAIAGALGAMGHVARSFYRYAGERQLKWNWVPSYFLIPVVGALLGTIIYLVFQAGLITGGASADPYGFAAIAALAGLFTAEAATKLRQVFQTIFAAPEPGADSLDTTSEPAITSVDPSSGAVGSTVQLSGTGLEDVTEVTFTGGKTADATFDADEGVLSAVVPDGAKTGPLSVTVDEEVVTSSDKFTVK